MKKVGVHVPVFQDEDIQLLMKKASKIEELGFDGVFVADSLSSSYEPLTTLTAFLCGSSHINAGTCVLVAPLRNPLITAKTCAHINRVSGKRLILGVGVGWREWEFSSLSVPFSKRGEIMDEWLELFTLACAGGELNVQTRYYGKIELELPKGEKPKIWVGGNSNKALKRALKLADGWIPTDLTTKEYEQKLKGVTLPSNFTVASHLLLVLEKTSGEALKKAQIYSQKFGDTLEDFVEYALVGDPSQVAERLAQYERVGVNYHVLSVHHLESFYDALELFAKEVFPCV
jgi:alkanesulfonate monooxygenase SsuD/methylene tetrahydromethanopterin reductase-like flavin-dependent oxidoreductase (luciferase family)